MKDRTTNWQIVSIQVLLVCILALLSLLIDVVRANAQPLEINEHPSGDTIQTKGDKTYIIMRGEVQDVPPTIRVPADYPTIQEAINNAVDSDVITVGTGEYGRLYFPTAINDLSIIGSPGALIQGIDTLRADNLILNGFDISPSTSEEVERYICYVRSNGVQFSDLYIHHGPGHAIMVYYPLIQPRDCVFRDIRVFKTGAGIFVYGENNLVEYAEIRRLQRSDELSLDSDYLRSFGENNRFRCILAWDTRLEEIGTSHSDGFQTFAASGFSAKGIRIEKSILSDWHQGVIAESDSSHIQDITVIDSIIFRPFLFDPAGQDHIGRFAFLLKDDSVVNIERCYVLDTQYGVYARDESVANIKDSLFVGTQQGLKLESDTATINVLWTLVTNEESAVIQFPSSLRDLEDMSSVFSVIGGTIADTAAEDGGPVGPR